MEKDKIEYYIGLMDAYLDGGLDQSKVDDLRKAVASNPFLKDLLKTQTEARANIRIAAEAELKEKLLNRFETIEEDTSSSTVGLKHVFLAIAVLCLLGLAYFLFVNNETPEIQEPQIQYPMELAMIDQPSIDIARSIEGSEIDTMWASAIAAFNNNAYKECLALLAQIESDTNFTSSHLGKFSLLRGVSHLKLNDYTAAKESLIEIKNDNPFYDQAIWYDALASFYNDQTEQANTQFLRISQDSKHYKAEHAKQFLEQLQ